jgi:glycine/D-amino acid oxidase-like deaminating enzyme
MLLERVGDVLEATRRVLVERHEAGVRPTSPDRRPWVGEVQPGIWVCNGLGTRGVLVAPWTVERLLDAMTGRDAELPEEIDVRRFRTFKAN